MVVVVSQSVSVCVLSMCLCVCGVSGRVLWAYRLGSSSQLGTPGSSSLISPPAWRQLIIQSLQMFGDPAAPMPDRFHNPSAW